MEHPWRPGILVVGLGESRKRSRKRSRLKPRLGSRSRRATGGGVISCDSQPSRDFSRDLHSSLLQALLLIPLLAAPAGAQTLRIYHIDVDQGDATLFVSPSGRTLLVDSGKNGHGDRLRAVLQLAGVTQIDHFVATHYHEDHYGGIDDLMDAPAVPIVNAYDRGDKAFLPSSRLNSVTYRDYDSAVGHRAEHLTRGETIPLDSAMTVVCISSGGVVLGEPDPTQHGADENDMSISLLVEYGAFRYFIGGDLETPTESTIAVHDVVMDIDAYQTNHHGADNGSSQALLDDMLPTVIVISNGSRADYRHPRRTTLARMQGLTPPPTIFQTNRYQLGNDDGGNVADELIADLEASDTDGTILMTVDLASDNYVVTYGSQSRTFAMKSRATAGVVIESLLPDPEGDDRLNEEVTLRNDGSAHVDMAGWFLRDVGGRVWALVGLGVLEVGESGTIRRAGMAMSLNNDGDTIELIDGEGRVRDSATYEGVEVGIRIQIGG